MSLEKPLISVLMMTYNHGKYIAEAIESVLAQNTEYPFELIICDDASSDDTQAIARKYAEKDARIVLSFQPYNTRFGKNFVDGCEKIRGKYVAFCEGDDYWTNTDKLQKQVSFLEANPDFSVAAHRVQMLEMDNPDSLSTPKYIYKDCSADEQRIRDGIFYADEAIENYYFQTGSLVLRWRFGDGLPHWFRKRMLFDHFMLMLHAVEGKIKYFDEAMSVWRRHGGGYTWLQTQDKGLFFQKEGRDWIKMYHNMDIFFSGRFHLQIRERILLAIRAMAENCIATGNIDQLKTLVDTYESYFRSVLKDSVLLDALRLAYPDNREFAPPWQTAPSLPESPGNANGEAGHPASPAGLLKLAIQDIPEARDNVWEHWTASAQYAQFFNLRSALLRWLWQKGVETVWMPAYLQASLYASIANCQLTPKFYKLDPRLETAGDFLESVQPGEAVLTINYLGRPIGQEFADRLASRNDIHWVQDLAQSLDRPCGPESNAVIYSPRKLFGVPDGGIIVGPDTGNLSDWLEGANFPVISGRLDYLARSLENEGSSPGAALIQKKSDLEHPMSRHKMSRITESILKRIPLGEVSEKRRQNWQTLYRKLGEYCLWPLEIPPFTPFAFPFLGPLNFPLEILHTFLARQNIACERMWHPLPVSATSFPQEDALSRRLLLLPCNQELNQKDLDQVAEAVLAILDLDMASPYLKT